MRRLGYILFASSCVLLLACSERIACGPDASATDASATDAGAGDTGARDGGAPRDMSTGDDLGVADLGPSDGGAGPTELVHFIGRFDGSDPAGPTFGWPGSAVAATFLGTGITATLDDWGTNTYDVEVDGAAQPSFTATGGVHDHVLASGLPDGMHDVVLTRRTESFYGPTQFLGFTGATLVPSLGPARFVEMIGDSITCGYGVLGAGPTCTVVDGTEAETHAWGAVAARMVGAANAAISYSGRGMVRNGDGSTAGTMPDLYDRVVADDASSHWDFLGYAPDAVVVGLGTNDFVAGDPGASFEDAGTTFVATLRAHWPVAWIVLATSPMLGGSDHASQLAHLEAIAAASGDARISVLDIAPQEPADGYGCGAHPSETTQLRMGTTLAAELRTRLGW